MQLGDVLEVELEALAVVALHTHTETFLELSNQDEIIKTANINSYLDFFIRMAIGLYKEEQVITEIFFQLNSFAFCLLYKRL